MNAMRTFEIDIPQTVYESGLRIAEETGITFSEVFSLGVIKLSLLSDEELESIAADECEGHDD